MAAPLLQSPLKAVILHLTEVMSRRSSKGAVFWVPRAISHRPPSLL